MLSRSERHWQILLSEYQACRKKLQSKRDAHKIMLKMLSDLELEKQQLQYSLYSLQSAAEELTLDNDYTPNLTKFRVQGDITGGGNKDNKSIIQGLILLVNKLQCELDSKTKLLTHITSENNDLKKDLKAVRADKTGFNRVVSPVPDSTDKGRENFLTTIQSLKQEVEVCNTRIKTLNDEATDFRIEREFYKQKVKSLTEQLLEKNECQPIADMESVLEENRELREKVDKLQHINAALVTRYHDNAALVTRDNYTRYHDNARYPTSAMKKSRIKQSKRVTFGDEEEEEEEEESRGFLKSVKEKVKVETELHHLQSLIADMQKVSNGLAETVLDKSTALKHQRASNRLLGERVTELEAKLRALEMSGFWNVPEGFTAGAAEEESKRDALKRLTLSGAEEEEEGEEEEEEETCVDLLLEPFEEAEHPVVSRSSSSSPAWDNTPHHPGELATWDNTPHLPGELATWDNTSPLPGELNTWQHTSPQPGELSKLLDSSSYPACNDTPHKEGEVEEEEGEEEEDRVDLLPVKEQGV